MYACYDENHLIAYHDKKSVVKKYTDNIEDTHGIQLDICKIKKNQLKQKDGIEDLYLVRFGKTYVQAGYLIYAQIAYVDEQTVEDIRFSSDILKRILELNTLTKKETRTITKAIHLLTRMKDDYESYTPDIQELKRLKVEYDPYLYNYH